MKEQGVTNQGPVKFAMVTLGFAVIAATTAACGTETVSTRDAATSGETLTYAVPNVNPASPDEMFAEQAGGSGITDLGPGTDGAVISASGAEPVVQWAGADDQPVLYDPTTGATSSIAHDAGLASAALSSGHSFTLPLDGSITTVQPEAAGRTQALRTHRSAPIPTLPAPKGERKRIKGEYLGNGPAQVSALLSDQQGRLLSLESNLFSAAVTVVTTGMTTLLPNVGSIVHAVVGPDGHLYAEVTKPSPNNGTLEVLEIDPSTFSVISTFDTGIATVGLLHSRLISTAQGVILYASSGTPGAIRGNLRLFSASVMTAPVSLPINSGLDMAYTKDDDLLLFGGPAQNRVSELSEKTWTLAPRSDLSAPQGSYIISITD